jgi:hypothetical protein
MVSSKHKYKENPCLTIEDLIDIKSNTNLVELRLDINNNCQQMFDFICDNFSQLKTLCFNGSQSISLSKLIRLNHLEKLELILFLKTINICSNDVLYWVTTCVEIYGFSVYCSKRKIE